MVIMHHDHDYYGERIAQPLNLDLIYRGSHEPGVVVFLFIVRPVFVADARSAAVNAEYGACGRSPLLRCSVLEGSAAVKGA
jgi:hypothetical protein